MTPPPIPLVNAGPASLGPGVSLLPDQCVAQAFTLLQASEVDAVKIHVQTAAPGEITVYLTRGIGLADTPLATFKGAVSASGPVEIPMTNPSSPVTLSAGTYYLVICAAGAAGGGAFDGDDAYDVYAAAAAVAYAAAAYAAYAAYAAAYAASDPAAATVAAVDQAVKEAFTAAKANFDEVYYTKYKATQPTADEKDLARAAYKLAEAAFMFAKAVHAAGSKTGFDAVYAEFFPAVKNAFAPLFPTVPAIAVSRAPISVGASLEVKPPPDPSSWSTWAPTTAPLGDLAYDETKLSGAADAVTAAGGAAAPIYASNASAAAGAAEWAAYAITAVSKAAPDAASAVTAAGSAASNAAGAAGVVADFAARWATYDANPSAYTHKADITGFAAAYRAFLAANTKYTADANTYPQFLKAAFDLAGAAFVLVEVEMAKGDTDYATLYLDAVAKFKAARVAMATVFPSGAGLAVVVMGRIQVSAVGVDVGFLNFGNVPVSGSATLTLKVRDIRIATGLDPLLLWTHHLSLTRAATENTKSPSVTLTNLQPNTTYSFQAASSDINRNGPTQSTVLSFKTEPLPDLDAPAIVGEVAVTDVTNQSATVQWTTDELADQAVRYGVGQSLDFVAGSTDDNLVHTVTLSNLQAGATYAFQVESMDRVGNGPTLGAVMSFQTASAADTQAPAVPAGLAVVPGSNEVVLRWTANAEEDVAGYTVLRAIGEGAFETLATRVSGTEYRDVGLSPGTAYRYAIAAEDRLANTSDASSAVEVSPGASYVPSAPASGGRQGDAFQPTLVANNVTPVSEDPDRQTMAYEFQVSPQQDFSLIVASAAGVTEGSGGSSSWQVSVPLQDGVTYYWRARVFDGLFYSLFMSPESFVAGQELAQNPGDFDGDLMVGFVDFLFFAKRFNTSEGQAEFDARCDFNGDGRVGFVDFLSFVKNYGKNYGKPAARRAARPVGSAPVHEDAQTVWSLQQVDNSLPRPGTELSVQVVAEGAVDLSGYGLSTWYDESRLRFVEAVLPDETLLKSEAGEPALFGVLDEQAGRVDIGSGLPQGLTADGTGPVATLRFRLIDFPDALPLVEIADGVAAYGDGVLRSIPGGRLSLLPDGPVLSRTFPNPFNIQTTIHYGLQDAGTVRLDVYNTLGQRVVRLVDARHEGGFYTVLWDGKDRLGRVVSSGIYIVRMQTSGQTLVRKMLLLK